MSTYTDDHEKLRQWYLVHGFTEAAKNVVNLNLYTARSTLAKCQANAWIGFVYFNKFRLPALGRLNIGVPFTLLPFKLPPQPARVLPRGSQVTAGR